MAKNNVKVKSPGDLEAKVNTLEARIAVLEQLITKTQRKKREYSDEEKVKIRARLLAGQEAARKRRETETNSEIVVLPESKKNEKSIKAVKNEKAKKKS